MSLMADLLSRRTLRFATFGCASILAMVFISGCHGVGRSGSEAFTTAGLTSPSVQVVNNGWTGLAIYISRGSGRYRLGSVGGASRERIRIPRDLSELGAAVELVAVGQGNGVEVRSPPFEIPASGAVTWTIESDPSRSYLTVR